MGKFLLGLVIGVIIGVLAISYNPNLPEEVRAGLAGVTALVMRGTERAADAVGEAADEVADEAGKAVDEEPGAPAVIEQPGAPGAVVEEPAPEAPPPAAQ